MIDFEDVEIVSIGAPGGLLFLALVLVLLGIAVCNSDECSRKRCPSGGAPRLMNHACLCVQEAG